MMNELEAQNEELRNEVADLRDQLAKVMKLLEKNAEGPSGVETAAVTDTSGPVQVVIDREWPPYGIPPGFAPLAQGIPTNPVENPLTHTQYPNHPITYSPHINPPATYHTNPTTYPPHTNPPTTYNTNPTAYPPHTAGPVVNEQWPNTPSQETPFSGRWQHLEERVRAIEGSSYGLVDASDLCLVPDVIIPPKFKMPEFEKYKGTGCPRSHLTMFCRKMALHAHDDKLLIHCFQDSLTGAAANWYTQLERTHVRSWKDLADAFLRQYKYNIEMAPDRSQLQNMIKREDETFKEYAQRWRELAPQVQPPLFEREMIGMFMDTLPAPFYDKMVCSVSANFSDMVLIGERTESGLRRGRIVHNTVGNVNVKKPTNNSWKKKEGEAHHVTFDPSRSAPTPPSYQTPYHPQYAPYPQMVAASQPNYQPPYTPPTVFQQTTPFMTQPQPTTPQPPQKAWSQNPGPNTNQTQRRPNNERRVIHFDPIPMTYTELLPRLIQNSLIALCPMKPLEPPFPKWYDPAAKCDYHAGAVGHSTENCQGLKHKVQNLINAKWLNFEKDAPNVGNNPLPNHGGPTVNCLEVEFEVNMLNEAFPGCPRPLVIKYSEEPAVPTPNGLRPITIKVPGPFLYKSNKEVPWKYDVEVSGGKTEEERIEVTTSATTDVVNIAGIAEQYYHPCPFPFNLQNYANTDVQSVNWFSTYYHNNNSYRDQLPQACSSVPHSAITTGATYESRSTCISLRQTTGLPTLRTSSSYETGLQIRNFTLGILVPRSSRGNSTGVLVRGGAAGRFCK
ncbi:hypothetical protein VNO77_03901 [Canavalia gladiata]|uniref:Retrotransposon gag domain-containing protein n=1 Tax=Canavalia gladiata TaxID=3824 RepID=A0AAN9R790_CANGL